MRSSPSDPSSPAPAWLTAQPYAHRGLHWAARPENGRGAFEAAIAGGLGIELDVRLSRDGFAVVFHDADLERLTGTPGALSARTLAELGRLSLNGTDERIEPLRSILSLIARRAPVLIELKTDDCPRIAARLCLSVRHALEGYRGPHAVMSFDPAVCGWFARHAPAIPRGLVVGAPRPGLFARLRRHLSFRRARPHFLAHDVRALPSSLAARARARALPVLAWTVRTDTDGTIADAHADEIIFEL